MSETAQPNSKMEAIKSAFAHLNPFLSKEQKEKFQDVLPEEEEHTFVEARWADGTVVNIEPAIELGATVTVVTEEGETQASDGSHTLDDGRVITTEGGVIIEINDEAVAESAEQGEEEMNAEDGQEDCDDCGDRSEMNEEEMGQALSSLLNNAIDAQAEESEVPREEIIQSMADQAGIEPNTVNQIVSGDIDCPPMERLGGMARALSSITMEQIESALDRDGCNQSEEESTDAPAEMSADSPEEPQEAETTEEFTAEEYAKMRTLFGRVDSLEAEVKKLRKELKAQQEMSVATVNSQADLAGAVQEMSGLPTAEPTKKVQSAFTRSPEKQKERINRVAESIKELRSKN